jgi:hypothetical protein
VNHILLWAIIIYFIIGLSITAFCVHMSYHEAAVGFGDSHDAKAQKVLESKVGPLGFIFLFTFWPLALLIAFMGQKHAPEESPATTPNSAETPAQPTVEATK